jgi:predicted  nucleic acid-binding Zn-ribbon protein
MHPHVRHLVELQAVDIRLNDVRARMAVFPKRLAEVIARVEAVRVQLAHAKEALTKSLKDRKTFEMDVDQWKEKVRKYKDQTGSVKTNEAYKALLHEIELVEKEIAAAEDRLLERMVAGEEYVRQVKATEKTLAEIEVSAKTEQQAISAEYAAADKQRLAFEAERRLAVADVPEDLLDMYQKLANRHGGIALAEVKEDESCAMCRVRVRPHTYQLLRDATNEQIFHCETCTRILYATPTPAAQPQPVSQSSDSSET